jgi:predicted nuclease of predicted toxin-antitoxin system
MKLLLDQGLPLPAAALLRDANINTIHVSEIGMSEAENAEIIQRAKDDERMIAVREATGYNLLRG